MAVHVLFTIPGDFANPDPTEPGIEVLYDDVTDTIYTLAANQGSYFGPRIGEISRYYFCTGTTQTQFKLVSLYPYARKVINYNSAVCTLVCDVYINHPFLIRPATAEANGQVTIRATTTAGSLQYSLDGETWQLSPIFTGLIAGYYTAYVKDSRNCEVEAEFEIPLIPDYAARFTTSYKDTFQETTTINILKRGYAGAVEEVRGGSAPLVIRERSGDLFTTLRGQEANIALLATENLQYAELFTGDDREFKIEIYKNDTLFWKGWLVGDVYQEPYLAPPYEVSLSATDGLGELKNTPFSEEIPNGFMLQWDVLTYILANIQTELPIISGLNIYETRMDSNPDDEPMRQAMVCLDAYDNGKETWDCAAVLDAILKPYGAFIRQQFGSWHIGRIEEYKKTFYRRIYNQFGEYISYEHFTPVKQITGPRPVNPAEALHWVESSQSLELRPAYKAVNVHFDYGERESILQGGTFQEEDFYLSGVGTLAKYRPIYWQPVGLSQIQRGQIDPQKREYTLHIIQYASDPIYADSAQSERVFIRADNQELGLYFKFHIKIPTNLGSGSVSDPLPKFMVQITVNDLFLKFDDTTGETSWELTEESIIQEAAWNNWQTIEFIAATIPEDGFLSIRIFQPILVTGQAAGVFVKEVVAMPCKVTGNYLAKDETFTKLNPKKYFYTPETVEATHGEVIPLENAPIMYRHVLLLNGYPTLDWQRRGKFEARPILDILSETILDLNKTPVKFLRGSLKGVYSWDKVLQEITSGTRYFPVSFEYNDIRNTINGEFVELLGTTQSTTNTYAILLETGEPILLETGEPLEMEH